MSELAAGMSKLNPFHRRGTIDDEDKGEAIDAGTVAGGGHASRQSAITKDRLRVSHALKMFLVKEGALQVAEAGLKEDKPTGALRELLDKSHIRVPPEIIDRNHPLPEYYISSSHNTYLMAGQLYGESNASAYQIALSTGSRCVEIDAWDNEENKEEPRVTHGYTLVSSIPFRSVCETIRDVVDKEAAEGLNAAPIMISLENHCSAQGQLRLVQIMEEVFQHRLLSKAIRDKGTAEQQGTGDHIMLAELENKVVLIVEYHLPTKPGEVEYEEEFDDEAGNEEEAQALAAYKAKKKAANTGDIIHELADLGVYAQSVKPVNNSWFESVLEHGPHHHLINVSESGLHSLLPVNTLKVARHNAHHLMRVYPKGTRISSANLAPVPFWGIGAQICALNWQTFNASAQLNEALFSGSQGYILKPAALRAGGNGDIAVNGGKKKILRLHVGGATDIPIPSARGNDDIKPYLTCTLYHPTDLANLHPKRKTHPYKQHHKVTALLHHNDENPPVTDPLWKEVLEWEYADSEMVFLRMLIKSDDAFARNPVLVVGAVRLCYVVQREWSFVRMVDLKGHETVCSLLVKFEILDK